MIFYYQSVLSTVTEAMPSSSLAEEGFLNSRWGWTWSPLKPGAARIVDCFLLSFFPSFSLVLCVVVVIIVSFLFHSSLLLRFFHFYPSLFPPFFSPQTSCFSSSRHPSWWFPNTLSLLLLPLPPTPVIFLPLLPP